MISHWADQGADKSPSFENEAVLCIAVLVEPLAIRFKYHFQGARPTNRLDKPEWMFSHAASSIREQLDFLDAVVQPAFASSGFPLLDAKVRTPFSKVLWLTADSLDHISFRAD